MPSWIASLVASLPQAMSLPSRRILLPLLAGSLTALGALENLPDIEIVRLLDSLPDIVVLYLLYRQPDPKRYQDIEDKLDRIIERVDRRKL
ncbi:hypothetical protein [Vibrio sp.]|uniref:hypothetical protein n=1 Tax=Vibrio sp. TaxID=678 RepID=UPI003D0A98E4